MNFDLRFHKNIQSYFYIPPQKIFNLLEVLVKSSWGLYLRTLGI